jgi:uncharacterized protein (DUF1697 family)
MTRYAAFLRGVNLGKRTVKSAELKIAFEAMGFAGVRTLLASGNVLFDAPGDTGLKARIEAGLERQFGFPVGTVLRTIDELRALVKADPFGGRTEDDDTKLYVTFLEGREPMPFALPYDVEGDFSVVHLTQGEVFILAFRKPDGRYGSGMDVIWKQFGKKRLWTSRNWNTVVKAAS